MPKSDKQKLKLMYLLKILSERTDINHGISMKEIIDILDAEGIHAERKSIYSDIGLLQDFGCDIISDQVGKSYEYKLAGRDFELPELKLLVDAVQSSKFITERKSNELIKKIEGLTSEYEAKALNRHVYVKNRIKTTNESVYYNVDEIQQALSDNARITFQYFQWNVNKEKELRHDGLRYEISPWALTWDDENYYMVGYDSVEDKIKHFRVDKMLKIKLVENSKREGKDKFETLDMGIYTKTVFGMYGGEEETVVLKCKNSMAGVIIDRFGTEVNISKKDKDSFTARVNVQVSPQFLGWVFSMGDGIKVVGPDSVIDRMREELGNVARLYKED